MSRHDSPVDHVTPYDRFAWSDVQIEQLLASGEHRNELIAYFGVAEYEYLSRLAREAQSAPSSSPVHVFLVPGLLGSQLGQQRRPPLPHDILWLDPIDIQVGRLAALRLPAAARIVSLGAVLYSYLRLKLHLRAAGFAVVLYDYDWRLSIEDLGRALAERLRAEPADRIAIVAHSMGGLVSRMALTQPGMDRVEKLILLGTPNRGSFAPVQALRGTYAVVRKLARLVPNGSAESLASDVFDSFPSLYQMLPAAGDNGAADLFEPAAWPNSGPQPRPDLLQLARPFHDRLAQPDSRHAAIVGVGQETVTSVSRRGNDFVYKVTRHGDGTVPSTSAALPGVPTHYAPVTHSDLTRNPDIAAAVIDLLHKGSTARLPTKWAGSSRAEAHVSDAQLRRTQLEKVDWARLEPEERRVFLETLNEPPKLTLRVPAKASAKSFRSPR